MSAYRQHDLVTTHNERVRQIMDAVEALLDNGFIIAKRLPDNPLNPVEVHVHGHSSTKPSSESTSRCSKRRSARCALVGTESPREDRARHRHCHRVGQGGPAEHGSMPGARRRPRLTVGRPRLRAAGVAEVPRGLRDERHHRRGRDRLGRSLRAPDDHRAEGNVWTPSGPASHVYPYLDEEGRELFQTLRIPSPEVGRRSASATPHRPRRAAGRGTSQVRRVPYRLPQIIRAVADGQTIVIVEGEKDADRAVADGYAATCCPMGAGKWQTTYGEFLKGAEVVIVADADDAGRAHALAVYDDLVDNHGCRVKIVQSSIAKDYTAHRQRVEPSTRSQ